MPRKAFDSYTKYALTETEIARCLAACNTTERECIIRLGVTYGIRRVDMARIKIKDIDFTNDRLSYYEDKKDRIMTVPLVPDVKLCLQKHINALQNRKQETLFESPSGSTLYRRFQDILADAGITPPHGKNGRPFHALRGTCYKFWQRKGMPVEQIAELLGDTVQTAMMHYGKATFADLAATMQK
jgi:integrase